MATPLGVVIVSIGLSCSQFLTYSSGGGFNPSVLILRGEEVYAGSPHSACSMARPSRRRIGTCGRSHAESPRCCIRCSMLPDTARKAQDLFENSARQSVPGLLDRLDPT